MIQLFREWTINDSVRNHEIHRSLSTWNLTEFDADLDVKTNIESIKIVFVFAFDSAFKKSVTSKKKFIKTNLNVDDVIIIMINQSWFFFFARFRNFSISIHFFFLNFFSFLKFWFTYFVWFFTDIFLNFDSDYFWSEFSFEFKFTIFCFFFLDFCFSVLSVWNISDHDFFFEVSNSEIFCFFWNLNCFVFFKTF